MGCFFHHSAFSAHFILYRAKWNIRLMVKLCAIVSYLILWLLLLLLSVREEHKMIYVMYMMLKNRRKTEKNSSYYIIFGACLPVTYYVWFKNCCCYCIYAFHTIPYNTNMCIRKFTTWLCTYRLEWAKSETNIHRFLPESNHRKMAAKEKNHPELFKYTHIELGRKT